MPLPGPFLATGHTGRERTPGPTGRGGLRHSGRPHTGRAAPILGHRGAAHRPSPATYWPSPPTGGPFGLWAGRLAPPHRIPYGPERVLLAMRWPEEPSAGGGGVLACKAPLAIGGRA